MSKEAGPPFSLAAGASVSPFMSFQNKPGWHGLIVWVPHPQQAAVMGYGDEYVALGDDGTYQFGKTITNLSDSDIDLDVEYSVL